MYFFDRHKPFERRMSLRTFSVVTAGRPEHLIDKAKKLALEHGALLVGNSSSGSVSTGDVNGEYNVHGNTVCVTITKKPFYVPWATVEKRVKDFFTEG